MPKTYSIISDQTDEIIDVMDESDLELHNAAPNLLEALEDLAELVEANLVSHEVHDDAWQEEFNKAIAAIKQAKGE